MSSMPSETPSSEGQFFSRNVKRLSKSSDRRHWYITRLSRSDNKATWSYCQKWPQPIHSFLPQFANSVEWRMTNCSLFFYAGYVEIITMILKWYLSKFAVKASLLPSSMSISTEFPYTCESSLRKDYLWIESTEQDFWILGGPSSTHPCMGIKKIWLRLDLPFCIFGW